MQFEFFNLSGHIGSGEGKTVGEACKAMYDFLAEDSGLDAGDIPIPDEELTATSGKREWSMLDGRWQETEPGTYRVIAAA